ncbi:hypothetical protein DFQ28_001611 [Apophysomyces sp. BC1034]|nr:hypothetical protein DFQ30_004200 [Apophysomyces sp. BC1015]KAG0180217.1 hypothetical protein DFQ29_001039 [Apophysomyces sp. BC1021]KAG0190764.1 hypothetical protein DFQ28_001611 [Apophysomyces sp. BC1034]
MTKLYTVLLVVVVCLAIVQGALTPAKSKKIQEALKKARIIPDVIPDFEPKTEMKINYHIDRQIELGTEVRPEEVVEAPHIWFRNTTDDAEYALVLIDADAEVPLVRHWIAINVDGLKPATSFKDVSPIHQYTPYHGPTPPAKTGKHRYVFMLYQQPQKSQVMLPVLEKPSLNRAFFNINEFVETNKLTPIAASYMLIEHQDGYEGEYRKSHGPMWYHSLKSMSVN